MIPSDPKIRLFIAIDPSEEAKQALGDTIPCLEEMMLNNIRWVRPHRVHLTVKFLGDVSASVVNDILAAMNQASESFHDGKFRLGLDRLGVFPDRRKPRVLWAGVRGDLDALEKLHHSVDSAVSKLGFPLDQSPYRPHLTLGRPKRGVPQRALGAMGTTVHDWKPLPDIEWEVDAIHLIHSILEPGQTEYVKLGSTPL